MEMSYAVSGCKQNNNLSVRLHIVADGMEIFIPMQSEAHAISVIMAYRANEPRQLELFELAATVIHAWHNIGDASLTETDTVKFLLDFYLRHKESTK